MFMKRIAPPAFLALFLLLAGCAHSGSRLERAAVAQLHVGQTRQEVRQLFGPPKEAVTDTAGNQLDIFGVAIPGRRRPISGAQPVELRSVYVLYDDEERVKQFSHYVGEIKGVVSRNYDIGRLLMADQLETLERGRTTRDDLATILGPASIEGINTQGHPVMIWIFTEGAHGRQGRGQEFLAVLDENEVLRDFELREVTP